MIHARRHALTATIAMTLLAACGADDTAGTSSPVTTGAAPTPAATPTPAPTPTPTPTPAIVEPYVLGTLAYTLDPGIPADKLSAIRDAIDFAINQTNTLGAFSGNVYVAFGSGTPTADAGYRGTIRFGGLISRRVALHELAHWLGSGSTPNWARAVSGGRFTGALATARVKAFDGADAYLNADAQHFWPYGLNYDNETADIQRNTQLVSAQVADMGLGDDAAAAIAGVRRLQNRSSSNVLQLIVGATAPTQGSAADGATQQWRIAYADGFITLPNAGDGRAIEAAGNGDGTDTRMATAASSLAQQWEMIPTSEGWFLLRNRSTRTCLDTAGDLAAGAAIRLRACAGGMDQQWRLVR